VSESIDETVSYLLVKLAKVHRNYASTLLANFGLYVGQELLLMHLWQSDGLSQSELVERLQVEPPTLSKMLQRLEGCGLVERRRDPEDTRICRAYLTDSGRSLQRPVEHCWRQLEAKTLANLTLEERVLLRRLLMQVIRNLN
jgi:MarR family transcriptional regulator, organic hydroperoxide resistance regulator